MSTGSWDRIVGRLVFIFVAENKRRGKPLTTPQAYATALSLVGEPCPHPYHWRFIWPPKLRRAHGSYAVYLKPASEEIRRSGCTWRVWECIACGCVGVEGNHGP